MTTSRTSKRKSDARSGAAGFTLIEILIMVAIIGVLMAAAVVNVASGREAAHARAAARGIAQMCHYANALALLRQRPVVVSYTGGKIDVEMSGEAPPADTGARAAPIYKNDVNGDAVVITEPEEETESAAAGGGGADDGSDPAEKTGMFFTRRILDPAELAKEDASRTFEGVVFEVETTGDEGEELDERTRDQLAGEADALVAGRAKLRAWSNVSGEIDVGKQTKDDEEEKSSAGLEAKPVRVVFETNGNCTPHRVTVRAVKDDEAADELMVVTVARTGKVTIGDDEDDGGSRIVTSGRKRR